MVLMMFILIYVHLTHIIHKKADSVIIFTPMPKLLILFYFSIIPTATYIF